MPGKWGTPADRLWRSVTKSNECWLWNGPPNGGYGRIKVDGRPMRAHRLAWTVTFGSIPDGLKVCHHCDTPLCVRPDHLFLGTQFHNVRDMVRKGRARFATASTAPRRNLTDEQVREIHRRRGLVSTRAMAREYGVHQSNIVRVLNGRHFPKLGVDTAR